MTAATLMHYLLGDAEAARVVAGSSDTITIGALLVLSAALARSWRRHNLTRQPWMIAVPFAASMGSSLIFLLLLDLLAGWRSE